MSNKLDLTKPLRCKDGASVTIYTNNHIGHYPIVGCIVGDGTVHQWTLEGICLGLSRNWDLENVPEEPRYAYLNVYEGEPEGFPTYLSRKEADENSVPGRVGCLRIKLEKRFDD